MNKVLALLMAVSLTACGHNEVIKTPDPVIITQYKYVLLNPPAETLKIPDKIAVPTKEQESDKAIAEYITDTDARMTEMEDKLRAISKYLVDRRKQLEDNGVLTKDNILE